MSELVNVLTAEDLRLNQRITMLIDQSKFELALDLIRERLDKGADLNTLQGVGIKSRLASCLIDIGSEGYIEEAAKSGIRIFSEDRAHFRKFVSEASIEYNLGNGKAALFSIRRTDSGFQFKPENIDLLTESKNHYWRSQKFIGLEYGGLRPQLLVDLANALSNSGRIAESLQYRDLVLREVPDFPHANASRARDLLKPC